MFNLDLNIAKIAHFDHFEIRYLKTCRLSELFVDTIVSSVLELVKNNHNIRGAKIVLTSVITANSSKNALVRFTIMAFFT